MELKIKVSIITVCYEDPKGLEKTCESLKPLLINDVDWEHIVVDSSPESHKSIFQQLPNGWPLVKIETPPRGIYSAQNQGAKAAHGDVLWFLNSGDGLHSVEVLKNALALFTKPGGPDLVYGSTDLYRHGNYLYSVQPYRNFLRNLLGSNHICHQSVLYRRTTFEKVGAFSTNFALAADYEHFYRCYINKISTGRIGGSLSQFDMTGNSSNYLGVFKEYRIIQKLSAKQLSFPMGPLNSFFWIYAYSRIRLIKLLANSPLSTVLRPLWLFLKRGHRL